jgi:hypothetical protein
MRFSEKIAVNQKGFLILLIFFSLFLYSCHKKNGVKNSNLISVWYGDEQCFGFRGLAQRWININGTMDIAGLTRPVASYRLNSGERVILALGPNDTRLAKNGDFNAEICHSHLNNGYNHLSLYLTDMGKYLDSIHVNIHMTKNQKWELPYEITWKNVGNVQDVVQVVDGLWEITEDGIRTLDPWYDRMIAFGDDQWADYEITTSVIFHNYLPPSPGPPSYWSTHMAIMLRWPGHDIDENQPHVKWYPFGASCEFQLFENLDQCRWRINGGPDPVSGILIQNEDTNNLRPVVLGKRYSLKARVESTPAGRVVYSCKIWPWDENEPSSWDLSYNVEQPQQIKGGSVSLTAHNSDITFGDIKVVPIIR